jgi:hypothetical protein
MSYTPPTYSLNAFSCPHCNVQANQLWLDLLRGDISENKIKYLNDKYAVSVCDHCRKISLWECLSEQIVYPIATTAPLPDEDMPDELKEDFNEARLIFSLSPRSSAALLRLVVQKLCKHLGYSGENINDDIRKMVADGLDILVQQAFDVVRVIGNESVHPGQIDLRDDRDTALQLFNIINFIIEEMITKPKRIREIYNKLPQGKLQQIKDRDKNSKPTTHP